MNRPTEYQALKRILAVYKTHKRLDGNEMNAIIQDSCMDALDELEPQERDYVLAEAARLETKCHWLGEKGSLEVLAAIAPYLDGSGNG